MPYEIFVALFGLVTALTVHTYFYISAYREDSGFTGLLEKEENFLMDSMVAVGGLQILYFLWRYIEFAFGASSISAEVIVNLLALLLMMLFAYHSYRLVGNMKKVREKYGFEVSWE